MTWKPQKIILRDFINATVAFTKFGDHTHRSAKSLMRMLGPRGNPQTRNLFEIVKYLQEAEGVRFEVRPTGVASHVKRRSLRHDEFANRVIGSIDVVHGFGVVRSRRKRHRILETQSLDISARDRTLGMLLSLRPMRYSQRTTFRSPRLNILKKRAAWRARHSPCRMLVEYRQRRGYRPARIVPDIIPSAVGQK